MKVTGASNRSLAYDKRIARWLLTPLVNTSLRPNHLTAISFLLGLVTALLFIFFAEVHANLAALCFMLAVFFDHLDGELARLQKTHSGFGYLFDYIVGGLNYTLLFLAIGIGLFLQGNLTIYLVLGLTAGLSNPIILLLRMKMEQEHGTTTVEHPAAAGFELEDFIYLIGPLTWLLGIQYFFIPFAIGTVFYLAWTIHCYRSLASRK